MTKGRRCFLSAPPSANAAPLERALDQLDYSTEWADWSTKARPGEPLRSFVARLISEADLFVGLLESSGSGWNANVLLEAGMAIGMGKPALLVASSGVEAIPDLTGIQVLRVTTDTDIEKALRLHLRHAGSKTWEPAMRPFEPHRVDPLVVNLWIEALEEIISESRQELKSRANLYQSLEKSIGSILNSTGARLSEGSKKKPFEGPDFVAWFDGWEGAHINPVAIEVKVASKNIRQVTNRGVSLLARNLNNRQSPVGLLIIHQLGPDKKPIPRVPDRSLPIFCVSTNELAEILNRQSLASWISDMRNAWAHGRF